MLKWHLCCLILVQMLAFSLLDAIIAVDWQHRWLNYLNLKGYLKHMVEGLAHEDHMLQSMLDPSPEPLKVMPLLWTLNWKCFYSSVVKFCIYFHAWSFVSKFDQNVTLKLLLSLCWALWRFLCWNSEHLIDLSFRVRCNFWKLRWQDL